MKVQQKKFLLRRGALFCFASRVFVTTFVFTVAVLRETVNPLFLYGHIKTAEQRTIIQ